MKRAPFLGGAAVTILAGCGGHQTMNALPQVGADARTRELAANAARGLDVMPVAPANVLANPIIGEAWEYKGATAPARWIFAQGQTLQINLEKPLFEVLGTAAGGDGKKTFKLPNPGYPMIVAIDGTLVTSPRQLAEMGRNTSETASLGRGAIPRKKATVAFKAPAPLPQPVPYGRAQYVSADEDAIFSGLRHDARDAAVAVLSPANRELLGSSVSDVVAGTLSASDAILRLKAALAPGEASALLEINDAMLRKAQRGWTSMSHEDPELEAARFMLSVAFTPEQTRYVMAREST
jgi:microcystin-dependent protein